MIKKDFRQCWRVALLSTVVLPAMAQWYPPPDPSPTPLTTVTNPGYVVTAVESDLPHTATHQDARMTNAWGIVDTGAELIVADNGDGLLTFYSPFTGAKLAGTVTVPPPGGAAGPAAPSGLALNTSRTNFLITHGTHQAAATVIIATEDGTVSAWNAAAKSAAVLMLDNSASNSVFKGAAITQTTNRPQLYLTDFHNGFVTVCDDNFHVLSTFTDPAWTNIGFAPFGIRAVQDKLVVTFAEQDSEKHDDVGGPGNGYIDIFNTSGLLVRTFATNGPLNSPWGLAVAPKQFGAFSDALLVGNFSGGGAINAYNLLTGEYLGALTDTTGAPLAVNGLWGMTFDMDPGPGNLEYIASKLYVTAGPNGESDGELAIIKAKAPMFPAVH